ncbi:hypothetical protein BC936DRAFT_141836, partial [Jimgerdemannia flammicorona]
MLEGTTTINEADTLEEFRIGNTKYMLPSDDHEVDRLEYQHLVMRHLIGGNFSAPMEEALVRGITVLELGCGS